MLSHNEFIELDDLATALASTVPVMWEHNPQIPLEIHLKGRQGIGKSDLVLIEPHSSGPPKKEQITLAFNLIRFPYQRKKRGR